ncbi:MAG: iron-containing alcohol dehydrogenase [Spirochaetes bacterium]|nr:iron-containing alcohol dehydrogenase [Spirochaetota bacterium]
MNTKTAVILAAGTGQRLDVFETNKPLVRLGRKTLISWTVERLQDAGIEDIYIVIRRDDKLMKKELLDFPDNVRIIEQKYSDRGMLGSMLSVRDEVSGPFFMTACDLFFDKNPLSLFGDKIKGDAVSVLLSTNKTNNSVCGAHEYIIYINGKITYTDNQSESNALEAGIYHFTEKSFSDFVKIADSDKGITRVNRIFTKLGASLVPVLMDDIEWFDINTPVTLVRAELFLQKKLYPDDKLKPAEAKYKGLEITALYDYDMKLRFEVNVIKGIINKIHEYEIIPHEYYYSPHHLIIDRNIWELYGKKIYDQLNSLGYVVNKTLVDPGERSKSIENYARIAEEILATGIDKKSIIISVGGGVIKDLAGFIASTLYRGIGFISFPTTILSQCDAAIALKQGVNGIKGKNLIGSYYCPMKIVVDPSVLVTLEDRYISDGLAECFKQSFAQDINFFNFFYNYKGNFKDIDFLEEAVTTAVKLKVHSVQLDFYEENVSLVNQYGHEVGHAVEYLSGYRLLHGESVAIGMRVSAELSHLMGIADKSVVDAHIGLMTKYRLPVSVPEYINPDDIINTLRYNKKFHGSSARFVIVEKIGTLWHDENYYTIFCNDKLLQEAIDRSYAGNKK